SILALTLAGCGGGNPPTQKQAGDKQAARHDDADAGSNGEMIASRGNSAGATGKPAQKKSKVDEIPYDAYFDNPLEVVANNATVAGPAAVAENGPATTTPAETASNDTPKAAAVGGWADVLPMENLQTEVKKVQNHLKASMLNPGTYNGNYKEIA